jgi:tetratricopeptide (TPR) repeat protein
LEVGVGLQSIRLNELDKADAAVAKLIADYNDHPKIGKALFQIGEECFYAKKYEKTIELLELIRSNYAEKDFLSKPEVPYILATCWKRIKRPNEAIRWYEKSLEEYPNGKFSGSACYRIAILYMTVISDFEKATYWFGEQRRRYDFEPLGARALFKIGTIYLYDLEDWEKGIGTFENYMATYPNGEDYWNSVYCLGLCLEKQGKKGEALAAYRQAYEVADCEEFRDSAMKKIKELQ